MIKKCCGEKVSLNTLINIGETKLALTRKWACRSEDRVSWSIPILYIHMFHSELRRSEETVQQRSCYTLCLSAKERAYQRSGIVQQGRDLGGFSRFDLDRELSSTCCSIYPHPNRNGFSTSLTIGRNHASSSNVQFRQQGFVQVQLH
jgi:hypothetical protein